MNEEIIMENTFMLAKPVEYIDDVITRSFSEFVYPLIKNHPDKDEIANRFFVTCKAYLRNAAHTIKTNSSEETYLRFTCDDALDILGVPFKIAYRVPVSFVFLRECYYAVGIIYIRRTEEIPRLEDYLKRLCSSKGLPSSDSSSNT